MYLKFIDMPITIYFKCPPTLASIYKPNQPSSKVLENFETLFMGRCKVEWLTFMT
jgi:hypothetical protein